MSLTINHPFHLVQESPWPLVGALGGLFLTSGFAQWFHYSEKSLMLMGFFLLSLTMLQWWRDVGIEGSDSGFHTSFVENGLRFGMLMFITSEVMFFVSFFWAFYHMSLSPALEIGGVWPPMGVETFDAFQVPLLNTIVLLSSGVSVTWAHHSLMAMNHSSAKLGLMMTIILGIYFTFLQAFEYFEASFSMADSSFGSTFFIATGFHGIHVMVGTTFLGVCLFRMKKGKFSGGHHFGFEAAAWYWHFVDVVWLFLYLSLYWWGGK